MSVTINCRREGAETDKHCQLEKGKEYALTINSPAEAWAEADLFVCPDCKQKAFVLNVEVPVSESDAETIWGGGSNREGHGEK